MRLRLALATFVCCVLGASTVDAFPVPLPPPPASEEAGTSPPADTSEGEDEEEADVEEPIDIKDLKPAKPRVRPKVRAEKPSKKPKGDAVCEFRMPVYEHEVVEGDIVSSIAARYGVKLKDIKKWNPRLDPNKISIGKKIKVCPEIAPRLREEFTYTVKKGDSLSEIGEKYGLLARQIVRMQAGSLLTAQVQLEQEQLPEAQKTADRCVLVDPKLADCWLTLGVLRQNNKDNPGAIAAYEEYLKLAPTGRYHRDATSQLARLKP